MRNEAVLGHKNGRMDNMGDMGEANLFFWGIEKGPRTMNDTIRLTLINSDQETTIEWSRSPISLNDELWDFLQRALVGVGFHKDSVERFFNEE